MTQRLLQYYKERKTFKVMDQILPLSEGGLLDIKKVALQK